MLKGISSQQPSFISTISSNRDTDIKTNNVEKSKVESLKEAIQNGTYKIDIDKVSEKMAKVLL